ncbi:MAG: sensor histidine kinase [Desulfuromonas sp.]|nr:MAG: sensor histidine kinase [Desulfuromonas sp.]
MSSTEQHRLPILVSLVVGITLLHYLTGTHHGHYHDIYRRLYYLPIVLGGLWFSLCGGVFTALFVSLFFLPHVLWQWGNMPGHAPEQYLEILLYNVIGVLTGQLSGREKAQKSRYQKTAQELEESYRQLRQQADTIIEIEEQLRHADRLSALGELSAAMAHEVRNPLGSIRGTAEILQDGVARDDPRYEFTQILLREVDRLNKVVQRYLDFARSEAQPLGRCDLLAVVEAVLSLTQAQSRKAGVEVQRHLPETLPKIHADAAQLQQAILNLILNALQAMPNGGMLTLAAHIESEELQLEIRDSGQGIDPDDLEKIFAPFFTTRSSGTGLGLAITSRIIQNCGGRIDVASTPGEGTFFTLRFPLVTATGSRP